VDRRRGLYALTGGAIFSVAMAGILSAQPPGVDPRRGGPGGPPQGGAQQPIVRPMPMGDPGRNMSPDDRMRFQRNLDRWREMPPDMQQELRRREALRQQRIRTEADAALRDSGLRLEAEKREQYEQRYLQERRRIEQALRQELEERRRRELAPVVEQLKREFSHQGQGQQGQQPSSPTGGNRNSGGSPSPQR